VAEAVFNFVADRSDDEDVYPCHFGDDHLDYSVLRILSVFARILLRLCVLKVSV
jgi:hypothetical protein